MSDPWELIPNNTIFYTVRNWLLSNITISGINDGVYRDIDIELINLEIKSHEPPYS